MTAASRFTRIAVRAHAKINLNLEVTGVRPDGYHLLKTVFQSLALHDLLTFEAQDGPFELSCTPAVVPVDETNLVWKAAAAVWRCAGRTGTPAGVRGRIIKRIPAQGGLGGGSADAAATLVALDALWQTQLDADRLGGLAADLGADVPFFLCGGAALGLGRGDEIHPLEDMPTRALVLVFPPFGVSTPEAFRWYDEDQPGRVREGGPPLGGARFTVHNDLQASVARRHPDIDRLCERLQRAGADAAAMTGSGSTVFGLFAQADSAAAAAHALAAEGWRAMLTRTVPRARARPRARAWGGGPPR